MLRFVSLLLLAVATATSLECYDCQTQVAEGIKTFYTIDKVEPVRVRGCPTRSCPTVPGGACVRASFTQGEDTWELRECTSTFSDVCNEITKDDCQVITHCTEDLCNSPNDDSLPTATWPDEDSAVAPDSPLLTLPVIIGISVAGAVLVIAAILGTVWWFKRRHDEKKKGKFQRITEAVKDIVTED